MRRGVRSSPQTGGGFLPLFRAVCLGIDNASARGGLHVPPHRGGGRSAQRQFVRDVGVPPPAVLDDKGQRLLLPG